MAIIIAESPLAQGHYSMKNTNTSYNINSLISVITINTTPRSSPEWSTRSMYVCMYVCMYLLNCT